MNLIRELKRRRGGLRQSQMDGIVGYSPEVWVRALSSVLCFFPSSPPQKATLPPQHAFVCTSTTRSRGRAATHLFANVTMNIRTLRVGGRGGGGALTAWKSRPNLFARLIDLLYGGGVRPTVWSAWSAAAGGSAADFRWLLQRRRDPA